MDPYANYEQGWNIVAATYSKAEIREVIQGATTPAGAIAKIGRIVNCSPSVIVRSMSQNGAHMGCRDYTPVAQRHSRSRTTHVVRAPQLWSPDHVLWYPELTHEC